MPFVQWPFYHSSENDHLQVQGHCVSTRVAGDAWFWDLVELSTKFPQALRLPQWHNLLKQPFSLRFHKNLEYLNLHARYLDSNRKVKEDSLLRWQIELRHLRENPQGEYDSRWAIFQKWAQKNQVDFTKPSIPQVADFFNRHFIDKNLKPRTIAGYKTSVADGLGSAGQMVSQSLDLNRLLTFLMGL